MDEKKSIAIVEDHKKALIMSGNLSDFHMENLTKWPSIVFNNIDSFTLNYNFIKYSSSGDREVFSGTVNYDLSFKGEIEDEEELKKRGEILQTFVQTLFWKDTDVKIKIEGKEWI